MRSSAGRWDAIVVGAGITGLSCASDLTRAGRNVLVLEARDRVGGRAFSSRAGDGVVDLGATWFWPNEPMIEALADQFGLRTFRQHAGGDALYEGDQAGTQRLAGNPIDGFAYRFAGGAQSLARGLAAELRSDALRLGTPVGEIEVEPDGVLVHTADEVLPGEQVVVAVPPALAVERIAFRPSLPEAIRDAAGRTPVWMGNVVKAVAVYEQPFWRQRDLAGAAISYHGTFFEFHDHTGPDETPAALFAFGNAGRLRGVDLEDIAARFRTDLTRLFGREAAEPIETHVLDWSRERFTSPQRPAADASTAPFGSTIFQAPIHERVHLASTETATTYGGHLEGAVRAGHAVARRL